MSDFQTTCKVCKATDDSVWEVVTGIGLCADCQARWYQTKLPVNVWIDLEFETHAGEQQELHILS